MAERENSVWGKIRVQLSDVQNYLLNGKYREAVILDKEILALLVRMQIDQALMVSSNLEGDINQLYDGRVISAQARDAYHGIRAFGELAEMGNNTSAQDANDSFSMLRDALSSYMDENQEGRERKMESTVTKVHADSYGSEAPRLRTEGYPERKTVSVPVKEEDDGALGIPIRRSNEKSGRTDRGSATQTRRVKPGQKSVPARKRAVTRQGGNPRKSKRPTRQEPDLYNILRIALPVAILLVVILLIRLFVFKGRQAVVETTAAVTTVQETKESTEAESTVEETTEAAKRYFVTTGVRVRTKPSTTDSEVLTVLDAGTEIQYKADYDNEWVMVNYNGQDAYISKQYVRSEEVQTTASSTNSVAAGPGQNLSSNSVTSTESGSSSSSNGSTTLTVAP